MLTGLLVFAGVCFLAYAIFAYYQSTDASLSASRRLLAAVVAGAGAIGGAIASWFHSGATP